MGDGFIDRSCVSSSWSPFLPAWQASQRTLARYRSRSGCQTLVLSDQEVLAGGRSNLREPVAVRNANSNNGPSYRGEGTS